MAQKLYAAYVTDWNINSQEDSEQDPFYDVLMTLDAHLEVYQEIPERFEEIDLLILHPLTMNPTVFDTISRSKHQNPSIKTIVISSAHGSYFFLQAIDVGVDKYLLKPLSAIAVKIVAERLLQQSAKDKEAKKAFSNIELMYSAISKTSLSARLDENGIIIEANDRLSQLLGREMDQILGESWLHFVERRFYKFLDSIVREQLKIGEIYRGVIEFVDSQNSSVMVDTTLYAVRNKREEIEEIVFIGHDLSEMNRAILLSMERLIDYDTSLAVLFNHRYEAIMVNRKFYRLCGDENSGSFLDSCTLWNWLLEENERFVPIFEKPECHRESLESIFALIRARQIEGRLALRTQSGEKYYFTVHETAMPNPMIPEEEYHILYFVDVTDFERLKEEKLSDAKLVTVGRLAAAITHEINTPITYIKGNLELLKMECEDKIANPEEYFLPIEEGIARIESIVGSMYEFAGTGKEEMRPCNLYMTLIYALRIVMNRSKHIVPIIINGETFSYETMYDSASCMTLGISTRLEQVWIIILNNALDEFEKGKIPYEQRILDVKLECTENEITVRIADNAGGIPEGILGGIFDFAVGGEKKKSMGIGLNVAKAIIDKHSGIIRAANADNGAVFEVVLKRYKESE